MNAGTESRFRAHPTLPRAVRLRKKTEFDAVFRGGARVSDSVLTLWVRRNEGNVTRCGIAVSRRHGNAVERNRFKRRVRAAFRAVRGELPTGLDLVVRPAIGPPAAVSEYERSIQLLTLRAVERSRSGRQ